MWLSACTLQTLQQLPSQPNELQLAYRNINYTFLLRESRSHSIHILQEQCQAQLAFCILTPNSVSIRITSFAIVTPCAESKIRVPSRNAHSGSIGKCYISFLFSAFNYMNFFKTPRKKQTSILHT